MSYKIFLDDLRNPTDIYPKTNNNDWLVIRNLTDFKNAIQTKGVPEYISFDNDLGETKEEGKDAAKWMVFDKELDISNMGFKVHSANSSGVREYVEGLLNNWKKELNKHNVKEATVKDNIKQILREGLIKEERIKFTIPVPEDILKIKDVFKKNGFKLYVVGGAVRDALLGKTPKDYDLATDALPDKVEQMMKENGYKTLPTGKAFGVINVFTDKGEYEVATFREDLSGGRRPDAVSFTNIEGDVKRRDLTINALFYDIDTNEIVDLVGGVDDLKKGIVRTVGAAQDRFGEDRLRILRAIRFAGRFGSELDPQTDAALKNDASLEGISGERIHDEFTKGISSAKSVKHFLGLIDKYKLFNSIFAGLNVDKNFIEDKDPIIVIAALLKNNHIDTLKKKLNELKYSVDEVRAITFLVALLKLSVDTAVNLKKAQEHAGVTPEQIKDFAKREGIDHKLLDAFLKFRLSVSGAEVMDRTGLKGGPELGKMIHSMELDNFKKLL